MRNHLVATVLEEAKKNKNIVFLTGDLGFAVLEDFMKECPNQVINAGIAEENMTSVAAGLALEGKMAFTYSIGNFDTLRCLEQIRNDVCYHNANVKIISLAAGFAYGSLGMSHHATEDIACLRSLPNLTLFSPCDILETIAVAKAAMKINTPCAIRLGKGGEPNLRDNFDIENFEIGKAYKMKDGKEKVIVFSTGAITIKAKEAVEFLAKEGIDVALYTFPTIKPMDESFVLEAAKKYQTIITLEEHQKDGGFGSAIAEVVATIKGDRANVIRMGLDDTYTSVVGDTDCLRTYYHLDAESVIKNVKEALK